MSKDIRSFFKVTSSKSPAQPKKCIAIEDDDDVIPESPDVQIKTKKKESRKRVILDDSDEEIFATKKEKPSLVKNGIKEPARKKNKHKTPDKPTLQAVNVMDMLSGPIKRTEPLIKKTKKKTEIGIHSDEEFEKSLLEVDINEDINAKQSTEQIPVTNLVDTKTKKEHLKANSNHETVSLDSKPSTSHSSRSHKESPTKSKKDDQKKSAKHHETGESSKKERSRDRAKDHSSKDNVKEEKEHSKPNNVNGESTRSSKKDSHRHSSSSKDKGSKDRSHDKSPDRTEIKTELKLSPESSKKKSPSKEHAKKIPKIESKTVENGTVPKNEKKRDFSEFLESSVIDLDQTTEEDKPKNKKKRMDKSLNESALTDEERHERKMHTAVLYQKYLNRSGPKHLGAKEIPEGAPNCLSSCAFLLTGVLDSFERDEIAAAISKYGGCVKSGISKKVTHVLAGEDAGPAKMAKAQELGIPIIGEDDFIQLIENSNKRPNKDKEVKKEKESKETTAKNKTLVIKEERKVKSPKKHSPVKVIEIKDEVKSKSSETLQKQESSKGKESIAPLKQESSKVKESIAPLKQESSTESVTSLTKQESSKGSITGGLPNSLMWVDKYKPQNIKQIIGQHGDASNVKKLMNWLTKWYVNRKAKLPKPSPWAKGDDGGFYKAVLLSGPPGVGKTTTVSLVCKELGFDAVEFNASDTRSKNLIREQIGELLTTNSLAGYAKGVTGKQAVSKKHVLVMDEVDGMAGNEDRGGMQELISLIKATSVPIICMCNDRSSQKMRSLVNYCYDLRFNRPRVEQIKSAMMSICCKEGVKIPPDALTQLIVAANQDVRQTLNLLSMWAVDEDLSDAERLKRDARGTKKDIKLGPWEAVRKVFSAEDHKTMSINDKSDLFFYDYSLAPLFVQENYLQVSPHCPKHEVLERFSRAADSISAGDLVDARIRRQQAWNLLPTQAMYSSVIPGHELSGHVAGQIQFPGWLGKNSRATKMHRLCQEIHAHTRLSTSGSKSSIFLDYSTHLRDAILNPLLKDKTDGIDKALDVLESYHLLREDLESLLELSLWPGQRNPMVLIDSKVKAAMTRAYNKKAPALPYAPAAVRRARAQPPDACGEGDGEGEEGDEGAEEQDNSDVESDALIKKKKTKEDRPSTSKEKASSSKGKERPGSSKDRPSSSKSKKK